MQSDKCDKLQLLVAQRVSLKQHLLAVRIETTGARPLERKHRLGIVLELEPHVHALLEHCKGKAIVPWVAPLLSVQAPPVLDMASVDESLTETRCDKHRDANLHKTVFLAAAGICNLTSIFWRWADLTVSVMITVHAVPANECRVPMSPTARNENMMYSRMRVSENALPASIIRSLSAVLIARPAAVV